LSSEISCRPVRFQLRLLSVGGPTQEINIFCTKGVSVVREGHKIPRTRSRFTSGIMHWARMPSAFPDTQLSIPSIKDYRFQGSMAFLAAVLVQRADFFDEPLPCGKSMANTLIFPMLVGSETYQISLYDLGYSLQSRVRPLGVEARLILLVRFSSNWSRSF